MSHLTEFPLFVNFPAEIRLLIWERVEQPVRIIGQVTCSNCWSHLLGRSYTDPERRPSMQRCKQEKHPDWDLKYIVHPRTNLIFPPLHACRESRAVWLPQYWQPPRYLVPSDDTGYKYAFSVPFISYEKDIFTVFDSWAATGTLETGGDEPWRPEVDPFSNLDRSLIRHVGICENLERFWLSFLGTDFDTLPALESLSVICLGPIPKSEEYKHPGRLLQMTAAQSQNFECQIRDLEVPQLGTFQFQNHAFFNKWRPRHQVFMPDPVMQPFDNFFRFWKSWLWHITQRNALSALEGDGLHWWDFEIYVFGLDSEDDFPVRPRGHTREEMFQWEPPFEISCKFLCEEGWLDTLDRLSVFKNVNGEEELEEFKNYVMSNYDNFWNSYDFSDN
ncbi:hypothetical protein PT974_01167 [Cladobotryum mycophilum]|uniref:2EXR domain-containing protein n=1 Tax=Cladobotryum mycophilum TaxID=491253 RepID=A0ABR0T353_9HYPO